VVRKGAGELHLFAVLSTKILGTTITRLGHWTTNGTTILRSEMIEPPRNNGYGSYTPTICVRSALGMEVFVTGSTGATFWATYADSWGAWSVWEPLGGLTYRSPAGTCYGGHHMWVTVTGTDNRLYTRKHLSSYYFTPWEADNQGGYVVSSPSTISRNDQVVDVFAYGGDYGLWWRTF
jgi:hypothetical protein